MGRLRRPAGMTADELFVWICKNRREVTGGPLLTPCWLFTGALEGSGYGAIRWEEKYWILPRWVLVRILHHKMSKSEETRHKCDVRACFNPRHLTWGTRQDNARDRVERGRARGGSQPGESHPRAKLTEEQVQWIRKVSGRYTQAALGRAFGVAYSQISKIVNGKAWREYRGRVQG